MVGEKGKERSHLALGHGSMRQTLGGEATAIHALADLIVSGLLKLDVGKLVSDRSRGILLALHRS